MTGAKLTEQIILKTLFRQKQFLKKKSVAQEVVKQISKFVNIWQNKKKTISTKFLILT